LLEISRILYLKRNNKEDRLLKRTAHLKNQGKELNLSINYPKKFESLVLEKCFEIMDRENEIILDITKREEISLIRQRYGDF